MGTGVRARQEQTFVRFPDTPSTSPESEKCVGLASHSAPPFLTFVFSWCNSASHLIFLSSCLFKVVLASDFLTPIFSSWSKGLMRCSWSEKISGKEGSVSSVHTSLIFSFSLLLHLLCIQLLTQISQWHKGFSAVWGPEVMGEVEVCVKTFGEWEPGALDAASLLCFWGVRFPPNHLLESPEFR